MGIVLGAGLLIDHNKLTTSTELLKCVGVLDNLSTSIYTTRVEL
jgi:hypothetical protein